MNPQAAYDGYMYKDAGLESVRDLAGQAVDRAGQSGGFDIDAIKRKASDVFSQARTQAGDAAQAVRDAAGQAFGEQPEAQPARHYYKSQRAKGNVPPAQTAAQAASRHARRAARDIREAIGISQEEYRQQRPQRKAQRRAARKAMRQDARKYKGETASEAASRAAEEAWRAAQEAAEAAR